MKEYLKYISSNIMAMIGTSLYVLADTYFIALGVGSTGLTALNLALPFFNVMSATGMMFGVGGSTRYAIVKFDDQKRANEIFFTHVIFGLCVGAIMMLFGHFFSRELAYLVGARGDILEMSSTYIRTVTMFAPAFILNYMSENFIKNDNAPTLAMTASLIGNAGNIILDYILIFPCHLGMFGAALATGLAPIISLSLYGLRMLKRKGSLRLIKGPLLFKEMKKSLLLGFPSFFNEFANGFIILVFNILLLKYSGNMAVAAYGIVTNIAIILICIYNGLAQGSQPLWSRAYAKNDQKQFRTITRYAYLSLLVLAACSYLILYGFTKPIVMAFNSQNVAALTRYSIEGMHLYFIGALFMGFNILTMMYFIAQEKGRPAHIISLCKGLLLVIPMVLIMSALFGVKGIFLSVALTEILVFIYSILAIKTIK